jgi:heptosyltransferase-2
LGIDVRGDFPAVVILWLSAARRRLGWACGGGGFLLTDTAAFLWGRHEVRSRQALLGALGMTTSNNILCEPRFLVTERWRHWSRQQLAAWRDAERPLIALHCGAGTAAKRWPSRHWQELLGRLIVELDAQVLLVGSSGDVSITEAILNRRDWPGARDWTGRLTLEQLAAMLEQCDVVVGADSGPAHLAASLNKQVVALFSGTNRVEQWRPWGSKVVVLRHSVPCAPCHREQCPLADHPCMSGLLPQDVLQAVCESLPKTRSTDRATPVHRRISLVPIPERTPS